MENYFNYFTEVEECFRRCRSTPTLVSPLDWALIESWKDAEIPVEAVLAGIERSFDKFKRRPQRFKKVNSLAYCSQEVLRAAEQARTAQAEGGVRGAGGRGAAAPFSTEEVSGFLNRNAEALARARKLAQENGEVVLANDFAEALASLRKNLSQSNGTTLTREASRPSDLEELERLLSALEEKLTASLTRAASAELLAQFHGEVERGLVPYRQKMTAAQIESLERQFLKKSLFEHYRIPRLSLFYL